MWARCPVEHVTGVFGEVVPKTKRALGVNPNRPHKVHDGFDTALGDAIKLMHVGRRHGVLNVGVGEEFFELP